MWYTGLLRSCKRTLLFFTHGGSDCRLCAFMCPLPTAESYTKPHKIVAYPTPCKAFKVWQVDSYGPLPLTVSGYTYILTAVDMFSKFLFTVPLAACTVSEGLYLLFTTFGSCDTLTPDKGTEFTAKVKQTLCHLFQIKHEFTPSFVHHCLGDCERTHATIAAKLTPFLNFKRNNWDKVLPFSYICYKYLCQFYRIFCN